MHKKMKILTLVAALLTAVSATSQNNPFRELTTVYNYEHYTNNSGLNSNNLLSLELDHDGKLWIGTDEGVNTFDGYTFHSYTSDQNDTTTINGQIVTDIKEIDSWRVFFALSDGGVSIFDRKRRQFFNQHNINIMNDIGMEDWDNLSSGIFRVEDGVYFAHNVRLVKYFFATHEIAVIPVPRRSIARGMFAGKIRMVRLPGTSKIFVCYDSHTLLMVDDNFLTVRVYNLPDFKLSDICPISDHELYLATYNGLFTYDLETKKLFREEKIGGLKIGKICATNDGMYWFTHARNRISKWDPKRGMRTQVVNSNDFYGKQAVISDIICDNNGVVWVASNVGLVKFDSKTPKIKNLPPVGDEYASHTTYDIFVKNKNEIWLACGSRGALKIDPETKNVKTVELPGQTCISVFVRKNGEVYFGTETNIIRYNDAKNESTVIEWPDEDNLEIGTPGNMITEDCLGKMLIATQVGVYSYNGYQLKRDLKASNNYENFNAVFEDSEGHVWVGAKSGVFRREANDSLFRRVDITGINRGIGCNTNCFADYGKYIIIGTTSGAIIYNKSTATVHPAEFNNFFGNTAVYSIAIDKNDLIWLSFNNSIGCYDPDIRHKHTFNNYDGLSFVGRESRAMKLRGDSLYFGQANNINVVNINNFQGSSVPPVPYVSDITYGKSGIEEKGVMENDSTFLVKFSFNSSLTIYLSSSDATLPQRNEYYYKVNDGEERVLHNTNEMVISGLFTGVHKISVRCMNADQVMSDKPVVFYVNIKPQVWLNTAALAFYLIMLLALSWLLVNLRFRSVNKKLKLAEGELRAKKIVEAQRNKLAKIHREQTDSINYAKRIQECIMPQESFVRTFFHKAFVYYKPKNIVSGDFYCVYHRDGKTFVVAGDCTGHGVPGAFISILGIDHLYNIIMKHKVDDAGEILTALHNELHETIFKNNSHNDEFNEGMDVTISVVYHDERRINFAGAMNNMYLIRDNEITTYRGDRVSIGTSLTIEGEERDVHFSRQMVYCEPGDMIYMFSDGYVDQFGGPEQKKFKVRRFKHLLLNIYDLPSRDQKIVIHQKHDEWRGNNEQTDDMIIVGFEPWQKYNVT